VPKSDTKFNTNQKKDMPQKTQVHYGQEVYTFW